MAKGFNKTYEAPQQEQETYSNDCSAYGCFLPATIFPAGGSKQGACRFHSSCSAYEMQEITRRINACKGMFDLIKSLKQMSVVERAELEPLAVAGYGFSKPEKGETMNRWLSRVEYSLGVKIMKDLPQPARYRSGGNDSKLTMQMLVRKAMTHNKME